MAFDWEVTAAGIGTAASAIREFIGGSIKADILRERMGVVADRLDLAKDQILYQGQMMSHQESRIAELLSELDKARTEIRAMELQINAFNQQAIPEKFVERKGLLFKRMADGAWSQNAHCPSCRSVLTIAFRHLTCANCNWAKLGGAGLVTAALSELQTQDQAPIRVLAESDPFADA